MLAKDQALGILVILAHDEMSKKTTAELINEIKIAKLIGDKITLHVAQQVMLERGARKLREP